MTSELIEKLEDGLPIDWELIDQELEELDRLSLEIALEKYRIENPFKGISKNTEEY